MLDGQRHIFLQIFRTNPRQPVFYLASVIPSLRIPIRKLYIAAAPLRKSRVPALFNKIYKTIDERIESRVSKHLTREEITAQCFVFLLAGFDTTATSLAFVTYLLAKHSSVQKHLQEEIDQYCNRE
ncbi:hypothetical protein OSTOST_25717, partial [Ostertagia ostertagi]